MFNRDKKVKVLQITSGISTEGIGTFVLNTFENINREHLEINFALATKWKQRHEQRVLDQGARVFRTAEIGEGLFGLIKHFINLIRLLKKEGPFDVVHSHMDFLNGLNVFAAFIAGVPVRISHAHLAINKKNISISKKIYNIIMKILINTFANRKLGCSEKANDYMNDMKWSKKKSKVLFNGIDLHKFSSKNNKNATRNKININVNELNLVTIGRMDYQKNPLFIVRIIKELKRIRNDIHLYWIGSGSLEKEVKQLTDDYGLKDNISFLGVRDDVADILPLMDFMLFPSRWEGLPIVLLEAQASGIPCFISNTITQEIDLGLCTMLSLDEDEKKWANKINHYIITNSYNNAFNKEKLRKFDIKNTVGELEKIYVQFKKMKRKEVV